MNTIPVRFDILHAYAEAHALDFNDLCRTVRDAIAEGSARAILSAAAPGGAGEPPLPEALVMVRDTDDEPEGGGWIVDCDCEGPLSYSLEAGEALYTANQMREYRAASPAAPVPPAANQRVAYLLTHPQELAKFVAAAEQNADDWLALNRELAELREPVAPLTRREADALLCRYASQVKAGMAKEAGETYSKIVARLVATPPAGVQGMSGDQRVAKIRGTTEYVSWFPIRPPVPTVRPCDLPGGCNGRNCLGCGEATPSTSAGADGNGTDGVQEFGAGLGEACKDQHDPKPPASAATKETPNA